MTVKKSSQIQLVKPRILKSENHNKKSELQWHRRGPMGVFKKGRHWYIDYYVKGVRKRKKIGPQ